MTQLAPIAWLTEWYKSHCNDDWEHGYGSKIETIDNPGWSLKIDLADTELDGQELQEQRHNYARETEWWLCRTEDNQFVAWGGPLQLDALIEAFRAWASGPAVRP